MDSAEVMEHMSIFTEQRQVRELLQEYLRRIVKEQPTDPISFLIAEIKEVSVHFAVLPKSLFTQRPFVVKPVKEAECLRPAEKRLDLRAVDTKKKLLREIFDRFAVANVVDRAKILIAFAKEPQILLETFPKHAKDLPTCLEKVDTSNLTWNDFESATLNCLAKPATN